jgi:hypothetical protein
MLWWLFVALLCLTLPVEAAMPPALVAPARRTLSLIYNMEFERRRTGNGAW